MQKNSYVIFFNEIASHLYHHFYLCPSEPVRVIPHLNEGVQLDKYPFSSLQTVKLKTSLKSRKDITR